jgi:hypothetical protein
MIKYIVNIPIFSDMSKIQDMKTIMFQDDFGISSIKIFSVDFFEYLIRSLVFYSIFVWNTIFLIIILDKKNFHDFRKPCQWLIRADINGLFVFTLDSDKISMKCIVHIGHNNQTSSRFAILRIFSACGENRFFCFIPLFFTILFISK